MKTHLRSIAFCLLASAALMNGHSVSAATFSPEALWFQTLPEAYERSESTSYANDIAEAVTTRLTPYGNAKDQTNSKPELFIWVTLWVTLVAAIAAPSGPEALSCYAALAARARSRTRWTIARRPFDRCDDKWSLRPRRPSSA